MDDVNVTRHWYDGQWWVREKDAKVWRCVECGNVLAHPRDDCPKCMGDVVSFVPQYDAEAEEMYGMVWWLAAHVEGPDTKVIVEQARRNYRDGLEIAKEANRGA